MQDVAVDTIHLAQELKKIGCLKEAFHLHPELKTSKDVVVAIHQPCYLPWIGYLQKVSYSDFFVFHDNVEFSKDSFYRRVHIRKSFNSFEKDWLVVPLEKHSDFELIKNLRISSTEWKPKTLNKIKGVYSRYPHFKTYYPFIESIIQIPDTNFSDYIFKSLLEMLRFFEIATPIYRSSELDLSGKSHDYNMSIVRHFGGSTYFSGTGAKAYQAGLPPEPDIKIIYQDFFKFLGQRHKDTPFFVNGLSFLDFLFIYGKEEIQRSIKDYENPHCRHQLGLNFSDIL